MRICKVTEKKKSSVLLKWLNVCCYKEFCRRKERRQFGVRVSQKSSVTCNYSLCECFCPHSVSSSSLHLDGAWSLSEQQQRSLSTKCHITYNLYEGIRFWSLQHSIRNNSTVIRWSLIFEHMDHVRALFSRYIFCLSSGIGFLTQIYCLSIQKHCGELLNKWGTEEVARAKTTPTRYYSINRASSYDWSTVQINTIRLDSANANTKDADCDPKE